VQPHIEIGTTSNELQIKGNASVTNVLSILDDADIENLTISKAGDLITEGDVTSSGRLTANNIHVSADTASIASIELISGVGSTTSYIDFGTDDVLVDYYNRIIANANVLNFANRTTGTYLTMDGVDANFIDQNISTTGNIECQDIIANGGVHALGTIASSFASHGVYCGVQGDNGIIEIVSADATDHSIIDFSIENSDLKGRIHYNHSSALFNFVVAESTQLTISNTEADFQGNDITTTGDIECQDLIVNGTLTATITTTDTLQDAYNNASVQPHIEIGTTSNELQIKGNASVTNVLSILDDDDNENLTIGKEGDLTMNGDLNINSGVLFVDASTGFIGMGTSTQTGSELLNVNGEICCTSLCVSGTSGVISANQFTSADTHMDILVSGASDYVVRFSEETTLGNGNGGSITSQGVTTINANQWIQLNADIVTTGSLSGLTSLTMSDDLNVNSNQLFVDASTGFCGINCVPTSALSVQGIRNNTPAVEGIHMGSNSSGNDYGIEISNPSTRNGIIDFTHDDSTDYMARLVYTGNTDLTLLTQSLPLILNPQTSYISLNGDVRVPDATDTFGIGTSSATSALSVCGTTHNGSTSVAGVHMALQNGNNACLELVCPTSTDLAYIDMTVAGSDTKGRIIYSNTDNEMKFQVNSGSKFIIGNSYVDFQGNNVQDVNLNSVKGQLLTYIGGQNSTLNINEYDFNYGNGEISDSSFGMITGVKSVKLKCFTYGAHSSGTYTTSTKIVFRLWLDGTAQGIYMFCDFSDTTNGNVTYKRFNNKFSSSSTSQVDVYPTITKNHGVNLSWETITLTNYDSAAIAHRISVVCETQEDL
jgi:hypothetical protein